MIPRLAAAFALLVAASPALAETRFTSTALGLELLPLDTLPAAPARQGEAEFCDHLFIPVPETPAGREAVAKGWLVTTVLPLGDLTAVSFVGDALPATSGTCELQNGNVGFFAGDQLVAILYSTDPGELMIGSMQAFGDGGLRVHSGDAPPSPVADLWIDASGNITATELAKEEPVCNGKGLVPDIYNLPIDEARKRLMKAGWEPVPGDSATQGMSWAKTIAEAGVPEVEDCSGTGFAFCGYTYAGPAGILGVTTAGEGGESGGLPLVYSYAVSCDQP